MNTFKITREGHVTDRDTNTALGWVTRVETPIQRTNGFETWIDHTSAWEARREHDGFTVGKDFPKFDTRREAADYLAR